MSNQPIRRPFQALALQLLAFSLACCGQQDKTEPRSPSSPAEIVSEAVPQAPVDSVAEESVEPLAESICVPPAPRLELDFSAWYLHSEQADEYQTAVESGDGWRAANIKSIEAAPSGFGTFMRKIDAAPYRGASVRFSGYFSVHETVGWAGMWMRVDDANDKVLGFDNMSDRPLTGTREPAQVHEIVLAVPANAKTISFGFLLVGSGRARLANPSLEVASNDTVRVSSSSTWFAAGENPHDYQMELDGSVEVCERPSVHIRSKPQARKNGFGTMMQQFAADPYAGRRIKMSGQLKVANVEEGAGLWLRIGGQNFQLLGLDNMGERPVLGTADFRSFDVVLDVPLSATQIAFGALLIGQGEVWASDLSFRVVDLSVPVTAR